MTDADAGLTAEAVGSWSMPDDEEPEEDEATEPEDEE